MKWEHYDGESIAVRQDKTAERLWVACPEFLCTHLDAEPRQGEYMLAKNLREPIGYDALERRFRKARAEVGANAKGHVMHGWRFTAAVALAEAGCSDAEIQAATGHKTLAMVHKYRRRAQQRRLSKQAQKDEHDTGWDAFRRSTTAPNSQPYSRSPGCGQVV